MGFSGVQALTMFGILVGLVALVGTFDLPGWIVPLGLVASGSVVNGEE